MLLVFVLGFYQYNISEFKEKQEQKRIFQDFEKKRVEQFYNYRLYGFRGFRLFYQADPISIFFINSVPIPDMNAFADSAEQLKIYKPVNTKTVFDLRQNWFTDYSGILLLIGSLLILFYGHKALKRSDYLRLPASIIGHKKYFWAVYFARGLWLLVFLLIVTALLVLLAALNGVIIAIDQYLLIFLLVSYGLSMIIFSVGFWCGTWKSTTSGMTTALVIWMVLIFFIPTIHNIITSNKAKTMTPAYQFEMEKLIIFMNWEKMMLEKEGTVKLGEKPTESYKNRMLEFKENELKKIQAMEEDQIAQLERNKSFYQFLSSFFPTTFYQSVNNEISSRGYDNLVDFCKYALGEKLKFIGIIIEKEFFSNYSKVEQFNAGDENIYTAKPKLPEFFLLGILFNLLWIAAFVIPAYYGFKKRLTELPEKRQKTPSPQDVKLRRQKVESFFIMGNLFYKQLYNLLSSETAEFKKKGYTHLVSIDDQQLYASTGKQNFIALSHPSEIPGHIKVTDYTRLMMDLAQVNKEKRKELESRFALDAFRDKRFSQLDNDELGRVFLALLDMKAFDIYLVNDVARDMPFEFACALNNRMKELASSGALVIFLFSRTNDFNFRSSNTWRYFSESDYWMSIVESFKNESAEVNA
jgi:ABC-type transport system involved in multi-copper enzyme maturation permease subunit/ABC-type transport system involved in cytochrome c biogenesis ATPase subunit